MPEAIVHLSSLAGSPLLDSEGARLGRVEDVVARLDGGEGPPPVFGLEARLGGRGAVGPAPRRPPPAPPAPPPPPAPAARAAATPRAAVGGVAPAPSPMAPAARAHIIG